MHTINLTSDELETLINAVDGFISEFEVSDDHLLPEKALVQKLLDLKYTDPERDAYEAALVREHELFPMRQPPVENIWNGAPSQESTLVRFLRELAPEADCA